MYVHSPHHSRNGVWGTRALVDMNAKHHESSSADCWVLQCEMLAAKMYIHLQANSVSQPVLHLNTYLLSYISSVATIDSPTFATFATFAAFASFVFLASFASFARKLSLLFECGQDQAFNWEGLFSMA